MSATTIKAHFKQYTGKGGAANLQFEVLTSASGLYDPIDDEARMLGEGSN